MTPEQQNNCDKLIKALRADMPEGFKFDFTVIHSQYDMLVETDCGSVGCAIGLMYEIGIFDEDLRREGLVIGVNKCLGVDEKTVWDIFLSCEIYGKSLELITPDDVADALEQYLGRGPAV